MRLHNPLDKILNNEIKIKLSRFLCRTTSVEWSGRELARQNRISPAACHKALSELQKEGILKLRTVGRSYIYSLDQDNLIVKNLLKPLYKKEEALPVALADVTKKLPPSVRRRIVSLAIFGSISRKKEKPYSDIDLFIVVKDKRDKEVLEENLEGIGSRIMRQYGNVLSPYIQTRQEFKAKFRRGSPLLKNILRDHILIYGKALTAILYERKKD